MKFLDLHSHPVCKTLFNNYSPWDIIEASDGILGNIIGSQANLQQVTASDHRNLICMTLSPVEVGMLDQWLLKLAPLFTDALDRTKVNRMISGVDDYHSVLYKERTNLLKTPLDVTIPTKHVHVLKKFSEYDEDNLTKLYVFFNIEGGHVFYNDRNRPGPIGEILARFDRFVNSPNHLVFYITPAHLTPNIFMTHAYSNKIFGKGKLMPRNMGITADGIRFLNRITEANLLVDVKHMSLIARQSFYSNPAWNQNPIICSHAGLTGCSWNDKLNRNVILNRVKKGPRFYKVKYNKPNGILQGTYFNPCSVNLYDEDVERILSSMGMIGIIMDLRMLGGDRNLLGRLKTTEKEFISEEEFGEWETSAENLASLNESDFESPYQEAEWFDGELTEDIRDEEDIVDELEELNNLSNDFLSRYYNFLNEYYDFLREYSSRELVGRLKFYKERPEEHLRFFVNQIFHIVRIADKYNLPVDPWKHICIGSDFDGYIRAIDGCRNVSFIGDFASALAASLPELASEANITLPRTAEALVEDIMYHNAFNFCKTHFNP